MSRRGWLLFLALSVLWGVPYLLIRVAVEDIDPLLVAFGRTLVGALVLLPIALRTKALRPVPRRWRPLLLFTTVEITGPWLLLGHAETRLTSVCTAIAFVLFFALVADAGPARATVITYVNPVVAVALGMLVLSEPLTIGMAIGLPLIIIGSAVGTARTRAPQPLTAEKTMSNGENLIQANGVELCVETFGDPADPAILLIHGACASMLWWETELCERIAAHGRHVIRYDNRDTGRSVSYPPGQPGYTLSDLTEDAIGILDVLGIGSAHFVGRSMSGAVALVAGVDHAERVASLTFVGSTPGDDDLPPMTEEFLANTAENPDTTDTAAVVDFVVGSIKAYCGDSPYFDAAATRTLAEQDVARARDVAATLSNHFLIDFAGPAGGGFGAITAPTLVVHGELDPVFPLPHGEALRAAVPGAELLVLDKAGHEVPAPLWDVFVSALVRHTSG